MSAGECPLSPRELEILTLIASGATNAQAARKLIISVNTVKVHLRNIFAKLNVESRTEAVTLAIREGWISVGTNIPLGQDAEMTRAGQIASPVGHLFTWQRAYLGLALLATVGMLLLPRTQFTPVERTGPFSDHALAGAEISFRSRVSRWVGQAQLPTPRARLALSAVGRRIYVIGGDTEAGISDVVEEFDSEENIWRRRANKPTAASNIGGVAIGGQVYVPGGYGRGGKALDVLEIYDSSSDRWKQGHPLPEPLFAYATTCFAGQIYLFGGSNGRRYVGETYIYDPDADQWERGAALPTPRGFLAAVTVGDVICVLGGYDGVQAYDLCHVYDPMKEKQGGNPWSSCTPMLARRAGLAAASIGDAVFVVGGGWDDYLYFSERYDAISKTWASFETPILGQWRTLGLAAIQNGTETFLYAIGGWNEDYLSVNERYRPFFYINLPIIP